MRSRKNRTKNRYLPFFLTGVFLFFLYLTMNTPLTGDDWTWGTERGMERLSRCFEAYNGRYISNILEILATRYALLRYVVHAVFSLLLVYTIGKFSNSKNHIMPFLLAFIALLTVPTSIYSQTFGWTAGFVNYVPSIALLLWYLLIVRNVFEDEKPAYKRRWIYIVIPLGFATQLIVEHVSLFSLFTACFIIAYAFIKHKKVYAVHIVYLLSLIAGSIVMFSNKAYWNIFLGDDGYRSISDDVSILTRIHDVYTENMYQFLFTENVFINLFIGVMFSILIVYAAAKSKFTNLILKPVLLVVIIGFSLYISILKPALGLDFLGSYTKDFEALLSILYFLSIVVSTFLFISNAKDKIRLLYALSGIVLLSAPFLFITPYGPRAAFAPFVFFVLVGIEVFIYNVKTLNWPSNVFIKPFLATAIVLAGFYICVFTIVDHVNSKRLDYLTESVQQQKEEIYLPELPFPQFMWMSSPPRQHFNIMFKRFYKVDENIEVKFIPYKTWQKKVKQ